ncbi:hypothetical protein [Kitasatospora sp. NPDC088134]|uniref:hypothetical protein n=1 Tax=Kitasatospora sp. NPDC088134 TaxID=3364071 RepID=UPI0038072141
MTYRVVRLPPSVAPATVTATGPSSTHLDEDGVTTVRFEGVLEVDGTPLYSPSQLLELWHGGALLGYHDMNRQLAGGDVVPADVKTQMVAYETAFDTVTKCRKKGATDADTAEVLRLLLKHSPDRAAGMTSRHRKELGQTAQFLSQLIEEWEKALPFDWIDDPEESERP